MHKPRICRIKNIYTRSGFLWVWNCQNADCFGFGGHEKYEDAFDAAMQHKDREEYYEYA